MKVAALAGVLLRDHYRRGAVLALSACALSVLATTVMAVRQAAFAPSRSCWRAAALFATFPPWPGRNWTGALAAFTCSVYSRSAPAAFAAASFTGPDR